MTNTSFMHMYSKHSINYRDRNLAFIDLEFTGLDLSKHEILEIACVLVNGKTLNVIDERVWKVQPEHIETADPTAIELVHYNEKDWRGAASLPNALTGFSDFTREAMLVGWNIAFDWSFLNRDFERLHIKPECDYYIMDVISLAYLNFQDRKRPKKLSLRSVCHALAIHVSDKHGALTDARATYEIYKKLSKHISFEK